MAAPVGILRNANQTQQGKSTIVAPFSDSDSEQEGINSTDYGQEYETEPEGELNTEEAQETLQHETLVKAGYLAKRQERRKVGNKNWKKRWFVLRSTKLAYYKSEKEYELLKILDLNDIHAVAEVKVKNRSNVFGIVTPKRTFYVQAESKKGLDDWVDAINKVKKEVQDNDDDEGSQADAEDMVTKGKKTKRLTIQLKSKISAPVLDKQTIKTSVKETSAIDIPNSQVQTTEHGEGGNSYVSVSSFTSGGSIPNVSSQPSSPVAANFVPERKDSSDPTASSEEEEGGPVDVTGENNNDGREIQKGYLYKLDRYKATWKKRWFVLDNEKLAYYKDPKDHRPHLNLNLSDILDAIETDSSPYKSRQHCFKIITPKRTYICSAPDETSLVTWLAALQVALTKTKEKLKAES